MKYKNIFKGIVVGALLVSVSVSSVLFLTQKAKADTTDDFVTAMGDFGQSIATGDLCHDINDKLGGLNILNCGEKDIVSFIGFQGGLQPPTGEGLDNTLKQATTAREFIVNVLNFALSFLGLIAVAIVIYGGFLYVTGAGNEDESTKGKKAIQYAAIGILIIIASYAIVNTLLSAGGGDPTSGGNTRGTAEDGSNIGQQAIYQLGAVEINGSLNDFIKAYKSLLETNIQLQRIQALPIPIRREDNALFFNNAASLVTQIKNSSQSLSKTYIATNALLNGWIAQTRSKDLTKEEFEDGQLKDLFLNRLTSTAPTGSEVDIGSLSGSLTVPAPNSPSLSINEAYKADFLDAIDSLIGSEKDKTIKGKLVIVRNVLGPVANSSANTSLQNALQRGLVTEKDIARAFAGIDANMTVSDIFQKTVDDLRAARTLADDPNQTQLLINAVQSLERLYIVVKDIQFVYVKISASSAQGNAPLIVEFNGLQSRDPSGQSIPDENYSWDPDGDGENGISPVECNAVKGPSITCTYHQPGTYVARLTIDSKDSLRVASGQAFFPIKVDQSIARIELGASVGSVTEPLRKYEKGSDGKWNVIIDRNELNVTTEEAVQDGITFDASTSRGGNGEPLKEFEWTFGDGSQIEKGPEKTRIESHKYPREGRYPLTLEVTDTGNRKDKKIVNIIISSLAARIGTQATTGEPETLLEFDGGLSKSDRGTISSYSWAVYNEEGNNIINSPADVEVVGGTDDPTLRIKMKKPGSFTVQLTVSDGSQTAQSGVPLSIQSRKPRSQFTVRSCPTNCVDPTKPSIVEFDASASYDPDTADVLKFDWSFYTSSGDRLDPGTGFKLLSNTGVTGQDARKLLIQFPKVGKYKAVLRVDDSHEDQNIRQEDIKEREFNIDSIVEVGFSSNMQVTAALKDGEAPMSIQGSISNADRLEINYGDGEKEERSVGKDGTFQFEHIYTISGSHLVSITASSELGNGETTTTKRVYISGDALPVAVMEVLVDDVPIVLPDAQDGEPIPALEIIRNKLITFDASRSVDSKGVRTGLRYSWDFGDQGKSTGAKVQHSYKDTSGDNPFIVTLTVSELSNPTKIHASKFAVRVISKKPTVNNLSVEKQGSNNTTPFDVTLVAEGAVDPDGRITNYQFWYYDPLDPQTKRSVVDTQVNRATLRIETSGTKDEKHTYSFCVSVTDNENSTAECSDLFDTEELPTIEAINGNNDAPTAAFTTDRTQVKVGEPITFSSISKDLDGKIVSYVWDFEGDGFQNDNPTTLSVITHTFDKKSPQSGYRVKLKVIDDKNAAGYSKEIPIYVDTVGSPPVANFNYTVETTPQRLVKFVDESSADTLNKAKITKWMWDFDMALEFNCDKTPKPKTCNGDTSDDIDSTEQFPQFIYAGSGTYRVQLTVEDNFGNQSLPKTLQISVIGGTSGSTRGSQVDDIVLKANLITDPPYRIETVNGQTKKVIHLSSESNGELISFLWGTSQGDIGEYKLDKNVWCDSSGDGSRSNDIDNPDTQKGSCKLSSDGSESEQCWSTNYQRYAKTGHPKGPGNFTALLTVTDRNGKNSSESVDVTFDGVTDPTKVLSQNDCDGKPANLLAGSLYNIIGMQGVILLGLAGGVIVVLIGIGIFGMLPRGRERI